jgi:Ca-activated chloride channel homolog
MKTTILGLIFLSVSMFLSAKNVTGKVADKVTGKFVYMARVTCDTMEVFTDNAGYFVLNVPQPRATLKIEKQGYVTLEVKVSESMMTVFLEPIPVKNEIVMMDEEYDVAKVNLLSGTVSGVSRQAVAHSKALYIMPMSVPVPANNEEFSAFEESVFSFVATKPLSTFSTDVDRASYAIVRRDLNRGYKPDVSSVRVEEMINYFNYSYRKRKDVPITVSLGATECPWNSKNKIVRIGLQTPEIEREKLPASNFVFLVDVSGSMQDADKLPLAKRALVAFVKNLREGDRVALVTYAGSTKVALSSTPAKDRSVIISSIESLSASGSTAGAEGLQLAYAEAQKGFKKEGNNRIILVTDGDFNVGPSSVDELKEIVKSNRDKGIFISVLGFGSGNIKDNRMETIADNGNGNYGYVDNFQEAQRILLKEFGSTLFTIAKDVKVQVEFNPAVVEAYRLVGYENRALNSEDFNNDKKDAGDMGVGQQVTALYEVSMKGEQAMIDPLRYRSESAKVQENDGSEIAFVKIRYKEPESQESKLISTPVKMSLLTMQPDSETLFASSVAMFGMLLRNSDYVQKGDYATVANLAVKSKGNDGDGYRAEFVRLVEVAANLSENR